MFGGQPPYGLVNREVLTSAAYLANQAREWLALGFHFMGWKTDIALYRAALAKEIQERRKLTAGRAAAR